MSRASLRHRPTSPRASLRLRSTSPHAPLRLRRDASPQPLELRLSRCARARPNGTFYGEIRSGEERIRLSTFETAHEAARTYDAVTWRLGHSRRLMNFTDVWTRHQVEDLVPPQAVTQEARQRQRELEQRLIIAELDERMRLEWARRGASRRTWPRSIIVETELQIRSKQSQSR
nr:ethylene-responsive transcription factor 2-like [Lolium perenne]